MAIPGSLSQRCRQPEIQDQPDLDTPRLHEALAGLERINRLSGSLRILWPAIRDLAYQLPNQPLRVLDVATGAGDIPMGLWQKAQQLGLPLEVSGCDNNPRTVERARQQAAARQAKVTFFTLDALQDPLPDGFDVLTSSLFLHHLADEEAVDLLRRMRQAARRMVLINDLRRSRAGYVMAVVGTRLLSRSEVVRFDGPASVEAAFTVAEVRRLASRAGLDGARLRNQWPFRYLLEWRKR